MNKVDGQKILEFLEGYYHRKIEPNEIKVLAEELKDYDYDKFMENIKGPLLKKVDYFTISNLHKIIEDDRELEVYKKHLGITSWNELYEN